MADCHLMFHLQLAHWSWVADGGGGAPVERKPNKAKFICQLTSVQLVPGSFCLLLAAQTFTPPCEIYGGGGARWRAVARRRSVRQAIESPPF